MLRVLLLLGAFGCFLPGCGGSGPLPVSGTVTLDGQPLPSGDILFEPVDGTTSSDGGTIKDGKFSFTSKPGKMKVKIVALREAPGPPLKGAMGEPLPNTQQYLPAKYNTATELTAEVKKGGDNKFDFALVSN